MFLCGIDEAGRGPLAGPVCAAAVIIPNDFPLNTLDDSKKMSAAKRERLKDSICIDALAWGIGWASAAEIDELNIHNATLLAMKRAFEIVFNTSVGSRISKKIRVIVDGKFVPEIPVPSEALIKADTKVPAVMAASILAKTARDRLMEYYALFYPEYGYEKHKGYPTKIHKEALAKWGPSPIQRMSYSF